MSELELTQKLQMASRLCLNVFLQQMLSYFGQRCAASPLVEILLDKRTCRTTLTKEQLQPLRWPCSEVECSAGNFRNEASSVGFFRRHPFAVWFVPCEASHRFGAACFRMYTFERGQVVCHRLRNQSQRVRSTPREGLGDRSTLLDILP